MNYFKIFRKPCLAIFSASLILFVSCTDDSEILNEESSISIEPSVALKKFENSLIEIQPLLREFENQSKLNIKSNTELNSDPLANEILNKLSEPSLELLSDYGFNNDDFKEMFGNNDASKIKNEIAGAGLLLFRLQTLSERNSSVNLSAKYVAPDAVNCFLEATGIAAGVALIGALTGEVGGKALKKAFIKAVKRIGSRTLGGIGLVLMAAEFTWCMTR